MYKTLSPGAVGIRASSIEEAVRIARIGGFQGVEINPSEVADRIDADGVDAVKKVFGSSGVRPAEFGLAVDWRSSEEKWKRGLETLPRQAKAAAAVGCTRTATWILSGDNDRSYAENRKFHVDRFTPIARILQEQGVSLGLEFLGPKTLRDRFTHPFIYRMEEMLEMGRDIGPNVGLLLDCWHWYTSRGTVDDLLALKPADVVYVHVNDAPRDVGIDAHIDNVRGMPGETGVIDIAAFLRALQTIGYDGPVTPEPFKKELGDLANDEERVVVAGASMDKIFRIAGIEPEPRNKV